MKTNKLDGGKTGEFDGVAGKINPSKINVKKPSAATGNCFTTASETKDDILPFFPRQKRVFPGEI